MAQRPRVRRPEGDPERAAHRRGPHSGRRGYDQIAYDDIVAATGFNRHSFYQVFSDKRQLFLRALDHYVDTTINRVLEPLMAEDAALPAVRRSKDVSVACFNF